MSNEIDAGTVAQLLGVTRQHFTDRIAKKKGFPQPVVNFSPKSRRWRYDEVLRWRSKASQPA
ncbi:helix-turn-helix transcriptional regulator [Roseateles sp. PN1]|uniref:helix-turn-helix transcriptional regulator n=1 Tax=Roseateles sp. PN1 TaxID=3137372 RepID=UPI003138AA65